MKNYAKEAGITFFDVPLSRVKLVSYERDTFEYETNLYINNKKVHTLVRGYGNAFDWGEQNGLVLSVIDHDQNHIFSNGGLVEEFNWRLSKIASLQCLQKVPIILILKKIHEIEKNGDTLVYGKEHKNAPKVKTHVITQLGKLAEMIAKYRSIIAERLGTIESHTDPFDKIYPTDVAWASSDKGFDEDSQQYVLKDINRVLNYLSYLRSKWEAFTPVKNIERQNTRFQVVDFD